MNTEQETMWKRLSTPAPWTPPDGIWMSKQYILKRYLGITEDELESTLAEMRKEVKLN